VEDEREREGRLFRRWCTLALSDGSVESAPPMGKKNAHTGRGSLIGAPDTAPSTVGAQSSIAISNNSVTGTDRSSLFEARLNRGKDGQGFAEMERDSMINDVNLNFYNADVEPEEVSFGTKSKLLSVPRTISYLFDRYR
jgi:hypothetical protein